MNSDNPTPGLADPDLSDLRGAFDREVRRGPDPDGTGVVIHLTSELARWTAAEVGGWSEIVWSNLDPADADRTITEQIAHFAGRHQSFAWRVYGHDEPPDLADRLLRAGFTVDGYSTLVIADVGAVPLDVRPPRGVRLVGVEDEAGVARLIQVHESVFGSDHSHLYRSILNQLGATPSVTSLVVAMAGDLPVSSARIEFLPARSFASLWGGGTLPEWRGMGIYRALVAHRATEAMARGYRYLYVLSSSESRPILERLGFRAVSAVTTYLWKPPQDG